MFRRLHGWWATVGGAATMFAALAVVPGASAVTPAAVTPAAPGTAALTVTVGARAVTAPLPDNFLGLALEYPTVPRWTAHRGQATDTTFDALVHNLSPIGQPSIRIGGQSTDRSWWPMPGVKRPLGLTHNLGPSWTRAAQAMAINTGARLMLGINAEDHDPALSEYEADQLVARIGPEYLGPLEIGNEPELFRRTPWYRDYDGEDLPWFATNGTVEYAEPASFGPALFDDQFGAIAAKLPTLPLAGPETGIGPWMSAFAGRFLSKGSRVRMLTSHGYGLNNCVRDSRSPKYPTVPNLLSLLASRNLLKGMGRFVARAHRDGAAYRIDEMGSVTCNGRAGVSDTFASALWAIDALFAVARAHVDGVNLHTYPQSANGLFDLQYVGRAHTWQAEVHPLYYGALMFAQAAPAGSRLLAVTGGSLPDLRAWATAGTDPGDPMRVVLINDSLTSAELVDVRAPLAFRHHTATVERLSAPSAYSESDITLGERSFGVDSTRTGMLAPPRLGSCRPQAGAYAVELPASSAALVTLSPRAPHRR